MSGSGSENPHQASLGGGHRLSLGGENGGGLLPYCNKDGMPILSAIKRTLCNQPLVVPVPPSKDGPQEDIEEYVVPEQIIVHPRSLLPMPVALHIVHTATSILESEQNMLTVQAPITICGDIHGQLPDLLHVFELCGDIKDPPISDQAWDPASVPQYLFLGDYVDRGAYSCETVLYLLALKIVHPTRIWLLRGNHESRAMTRKSYGKEGSNFKQECVAKYDEAFYDAVMACFDQLPLCAVVANEHSSSPMETDSPPTFSPDDMANHGQYRNWHRFLCMHGGLSPQIKTLEDFAKIDRRKEPPLKGAVCDVLWADPLADHLAADLNERDYEEFLELDFLPNPPRGCSVFFGYDAILPFVKRNQLDGIIRGHQVVQEGVAFQYAQTRSDSFPFPMVTTVFTASNYCGTYLNLGAVLHLHPTKGITFSKFELLPPGADEMQLAAQRSAAFVKATLQDAASEIHPGWSSLRRVIRTVSALRTIGANALGRIHTAPVVSSKSEMDTPLSAIKETATNPFSFANRTAVDSSSLPVTPIKDLKQPADIVAMARTIVPDDMSQLRLIFDSIDVNKDGHLQPHEFECFLEGLSSENATPQAAATLKKMIEAMDVDKNGEISFEEFTLFFSQLDLNMPPSPPMANTQTAVSLTENKTQAAADTETVSLPGEPTRGGFDSVRRMSTRVKASIPRSAAILSPTHKPRA